MKYSEVLYVSDLDGTFFNNFGILSKRAYEFLDNNLADIPLTFSTARSFDSASQALGDIKLSLPISVYNGALIYDPLTQEIYKSYDIDNDFVTETVEIMRNNRVVPMVYTLDKEWNDKIFYTGVCDGENDIYITKRTKMKDKRLTYDENMSNWQSDRVLYLSCVDKYEKLKNIQDSLNKSDKYNSILSPTRYLKGLYWLEIMNKKATKGESVRVLKELQNAERIVAFGDNFNDIPMLQTADIGIAVGNAEEEVKKHADKIIAPNTEDSVLDYILNDLGISY